MPAVMFKIVDCPSRERILEAHRYANSPEAGAQLKIIKLTIQKSSLKPVELFTEVTGVVYLGTTRDDLTLRLRTDVETLDYHGFVFSTYEALAHLNTTNRRGTISLNPSFA